MMTLEKPETGSIAYLQAELAEYERAYQMPTAEFLRRCEDPNDSLADVEDAVFWRELHAILQQVLADGEPPSFQTLDDELTEGSKGPSVSLWTSMRILCEFWL